jgi:signal recognition particle subunit SRP54
MTPAERREPDLINGSRRARIAKGSGRSTQEVNNLLKQFKQMQQMMRQMGPLGRMATRKGKKKKGGRVTPAGTQARAKSRPGGGGPNPFGQMPPGFGDLGDLGGLGGGAGGGGGGGGFPGLPPKR